jgi:Uri superfamily endonuclease
MLSSSVESSNAALFQAGRRYARAQSTLSVSNPHPPRVLDQIGVRYSESRAEVRTAIEFFEAVRSLANEIDPAVKKLILDGSNPYLTPARVRQIARCCSVKRRQSAISHALRGFHPFTRSVTADLRDELTVWNHHLEQLRKAHELLYTTLSGLGELSRTSDGLSGTYVDAIAIRVSTAALVHALRGAGFAPGNAVPKVKLPPNSGSVEANGASGRARRLVESVVADLPLMLASQAELPKAMNSLATAVQGIGRLANDLVARTVESRTVTGKRATFVPSLEGPGPEGGTYVIVLRLTESKVLRIGRLGTFWLPAGYWLYVGSAFGGGGVAARTGRHRSKEAPKRWNIDHLKAIATPVELWWTHSPEKVECQWAMTLASLPGYSCPAPRCGANDCKQCPAHLFHSIEPPALSKLVERVAVGVDHSFKVCRQQLA